MTPGTVLRLGTASPVPIRWRGALVAVLGTRKGWVYHARLRRSYRAMGDRGVLVVRWRTKPTRCYTTTWERRTSLAVVQMGTTYEIEPGALEAAVRVLTLP